MDNDTDTRHEEGTTMYALKATYRGNRGRGPEQSHLLSTGGVPRTYPTRERAQMMADGLNAAGARIVVVEVPR